MEKILLLIADDDEVDRMALIRSLEELNADIKEAINGSQIFDYLKSNYFDCIILDYILPDFDGLTIIKQIRSVGYLVPIIVITGHGDELLAVEMLKAGAQDYIPKCKAPELIVRAVKNAVESQKAAKEVEYFKNFYYNAPIGFFTTTLEDGKIIKANSALSMILDYDTMEDLYAKPITLLYNNPSQREELITKIKRDGYVKEMHINLNTNKDRNIWLSITAKLCRGLCQVEGKCLHHCPGKRCIEGSVIDITYKKSLELELQRLKMKEMEALQEIQEAISKKIKDYRYL
jgi:DNA-binding response OmpR family regulator